MKFPIDESLSPTLAAVARERGFPESTHVTWLGLRSGQDWMLVQRAIDDDYVLITHDSASSTRPYSAGKGLSLPEYTDLVIERMEDASDPGVASRSKTAVKVDVSVLPICRTAMFSGQRPNDAL